MAGIALSSILGGAMLAIALAFGISAVVAPMTFAQVPPQIIAVQMLAVVLLAALALDGQLSRVDGGILLIGFGLAVLYLVRLGRRGLDITPLAFITTAMVSGFMLTKRVPRWAGGFLILLYAVFVVGGWVMLWAIVS